MIQNELRFCDLKKVFLTFGLTLAVLLYIFFAQLLPSRRTAEWDDLEKMKQAEIPIAAAVKHMEQDIDDLNKMIAGAESAKKSVTELETQKQSLRQDMERYQTLHKKVKEYQWNHAMREDLLRQQKYWQELDELIGRLFIDEMKNQGKIFAYQGYGLSSELDWANRILLRQAGAGKETLDAQRFIRFVLGNSQLFAAVCVFVIGFLNLSIWSRDFEENEGKLLLTLPYQRKVLFHTRIWLRFGLSLAAVLLPLLGMFIWLGCRYGFGTGRMVLLNRSVFNSLFSNTITRQKMEAADFLSIHQTVPQWQYGLLLVVGLLLWLAAIFLIFNLISLYLRSSLLGVFVVLFAIVGVFQSATASLTNPLSFFHQTEILYGLQRSNTYDYRIIEPGIACFWILLLLLSVLSYNWAKWKFKHM